MRRGSTATAFRPSPAGAALVARAGRRLSGDPPEAGDRLSNPRGDHSIDPTGATAPPDAPHRLAAVLVPIVDAETGLAVLLTQRASHLRHHSGQIAFPGGTVDPEDVSPVGTALREAEEEVALPREAVLPLGYLDPYLSATGFLVTPVVALVEPGVRLRPNPDEVAEVFMVPLDHLMEPAHYHVRTHPWQGRSRASYVVVHEGRSIWGVTAGILHNLRERLFR